MHAANDEALDDVIDERNGDEFAESREGAVQDERLPPRNSIVIFRHITDSIINSKRT